MSNIRLFVLDYRAAERRAFNFFVLTYMVAVFTFLYVMGF